MLFLLKVLRFLPCSAIDLLEKMLELDADRRITAEQTLAHPYLAQVPTEHILVHIYLIP